MWTDRPMIHILPYLLEKTAVRWVDQVMMIGSQMIHNQFYLPDRIELYRESRVVVETEPVPVLAQSNLALGMGFAYLIYLF